jgi:hypothetical protein
MLCGVIAILVLLSATPARSKNQDVGALEGTWKCIFFSGEGEIIPEEIGSILKVDRKLISQKYLFRWAGSETNKYSFIGYSPTQIQPPNPTTKASPQSQPTKAIDMTMVERTTKQDGTVVEEATLLAKGIYLIKGDLAVLSFNEPDDPSESLALKRPRQFSMKNWVFAVFRKVPADDINSKNEKKTKKFSRLNKKRGHSTF